ncbi:acyl-CoA thioesterase [Leucobacter sp. UCD-THU]|jgi:acyl-CoA thioesterase-2|uniref:Acyl-CoA thioesterase II n=1 Tax=Leucobacter muris TaxID=1935379 RepID=A0ABX5QGC4_9MICO|nr:MULTISPECIES: acyl-CoA thioesterase II [Leucobacter]EYT53792.1 acyl-CoA thioesterase [Leucobacter sp. UCD-THU]QAB18031.1 acyl-CoA thioesterase II [Leucobacter muris]
MTAFPDLLAMLSVLDSGARTREDILTGPAFPTPHGRSFGGQVLGQAIAAAGTTVADDRLLHSMHGYFLRPGESEERMTFEVARLHDGRSFSTRRVQAYQDGEVLMSMISSFQEDDPGLEHQEPVSLDGLPEPESLPSVWEKYGHLSGSGRASWILGRPFDFRYLESDVVLDVAERVSRQRVWMRSRDTFEATHLLQCAALAFASDYLLLEPIARRHGIPWATPGMRAASLDHAMWFHRPFRVDDWLLYELDSPTSQGGRGLAHGRFYDREGRLVASVSQESMIRLPDAG